MTLELHHKIEQLETQLESAHAEIAAWHAAAMTWMWMEIPAKKMTPSVLQDLLTLYHLREAMLLSEASLDIVRSRIPWYTEADAAEEDAEEEAK